MLNKQLFKTSIFYAFMAVLFSNCRIYAPATTGNAPAYISYPWYDGKAVSSVSISARGNTGTAYVGGDKNKFGEINAHYSRVFEIGHLSLTAGGYTGNYKKLVPQKSILSYAGATLGGEMAFHIPSFMSLLGMMGPLTNNETIETSTGIGYEFKTENGSYFNFRRALPDSALGGNSATKLNPIASHSLHKISFFKDLRHQIDKNNIHGVRADFTLAYEGDFQPTSMNTGFTYHFTHKMVTFYGQGGFGFNSSDNILKPLWGLGINYAVWTK